MMAVRKYARTCRKCGGNIFSRQWGDRVSYCVFCLKKRRMRRFRGPALKEKDMLRRWRSPDA